MTVTMPWWTLACWIFFSVRICANVTMKCLVNCTGWHYLYKWSLNEQRGHRSILEEESFDYILLLLFFPLIDPHTVSVAVEYSSQAKVTQTQKDKQMYTESRLLLASRRGIFRHHLIVFSGHLIFSFYSFFSHWPNYHWREKIYVLSECFFNDTLGAPSNKITLYVLDVYIQWRQQAEWKYALNLFSPLHLYYMPKSIAWKKRLTELCLCLCVYFCLISIFLCGQGNFTFWTQFKPQSTSNAIQEERKSFFSILHLEEGQEFLFLF